MVRVVADDWLSTTMTTMIAVATQALTAFFETYDILLSPVMRHPPKPIGEHATDQPFQALWDKVVDNVAYTPAFNASGMPAMSVPLNWTPGGLPIGSQFAAGLGGESTLFGLAYQLEAARPWAGKWAPYSYPALQDAPYLDRSVTSER